MASRRTASAGANDARKMAKIVTNPKGSEQSLSRADQVAFREAKASVVEARRNAPSNEGRLQIS